MSIMLPEIDFERIGQRVKQARIDKGYTQAELGEVIGCSNNHMSVWLGAMLRYALYKSCSCAALISSVFR